MIIALHTSRLEKHIMPKRLHIDVNKNTFLIMPSLNDQYWSIKLVSFCPDYLFSDLYSIYGTLVMADAKIPEPLATMDGSLVTAMRTAAVTAVGVKNFAPTDSHSLGNVGTGIQGIYQAIFDLFDAKLIYEKHLQKGF